MKLEPTNRKEANENRAGRLALVDYMMHIITTEPDTRIVISNHNGYLHIATERKANNEIQTQTDDS